MKTTTTKTLATLSIRESKKTKMTLTICDGRLFYGTTTTSDYYRLLDDDSVVVSTKTLEKSPYLAPTSLRSCDIPNSDFVVSAVEYTTPRVVYSLLKNLYSRSGHSYLLRLQRELVKLQPIDFIKQFEESFVASFDGNESDMYISSCRAINSSTKGIKEVVADIKATMLCHTTIRKRHTYKIVGKNRVECIPYFTELKSAYGKEFDKLQLDTTTDFDIEDLMQECRLATYQLIKCGLVNSVSDIWEYREYLFKVLNRLIRAEKSKANRRINCYIHSENVTDDEYKETLINKSQMAELIDDYDVIDKQRVVIKLRNVLENSLTAKHNKPMILRVYDMRYINGMTQKQVEQALCVDHRQVVRFETTIKQVMATPQVYEVLRIDMAL